MAGTIKADIIQSELSTPTVFRNSSNTEIGTLCRSWLNYNGVTLAVRASFNVSSVTRNGTGDYTVNFTNSLTDANYSFSSSSGQNASVGPVPVGPQSATAPTSSALRIESGAFSNNTRSDNSYIQVTVFR